MIGVFTKIGLGFNFKFYSSKRDGCLVLGDENIFLVEVGSLNPLLKDLIKSGWLIVFLSDWVNCNYLKIDYEESNFEYYNF